MHLTKKNLSFRRLPWSQISALCFYLTIFTLPFAKKIFLETSFSFVKQTFIEYNSLYLTLSEIIFLAFLFLERKSILKNIFNKKSNKITIPILIAILFFINFVKSENYLLSLHKNFHLFLWAIFSLIIIKKISNLKNLFRILQISIAAATLQSIIAIIQFTHQKSIGLNILGESPLSKEILGVAKINLGQTVLIRAYGTEPHPNILAGFLFLNLILIFFYLSLLKKDSVLKDNFIAHKLCSTWNNLKFFLLKIREKGTSIKKNKVYFNFYNQKLFKKEVLIISISALLITLGIFLTFSKTILFLLVIFLIGITLFHVEQFTWLGQIAKFLLLTLIIFALVFHPIVFSRFREHHIPDCSTWNNLDCNATLRQNYLKISQKIVYSKPFWGTGSGTFVSVMPSFIQGEIAPWDLQPVHNIYLLVASDLGLIILIILLILMLLTLFHVEQFRPQLNTSLLRFGLLLILLSGLTDHYLYSFPIGNAILALIIGLVCAADRLNYELFHVEQFRRSHKFKQLLNEQFSK